MDPIVIVHAVLAVLLLVSTLVVGVWGLARSRALAGASRPREARAFAQVLQLSHTLVAAAGLAGLVLLGSQHRHPADPLHTRVYGVFMVLAIIAAYGYRTPDAQRNVRVFAVTSLVIFALALRAVATAN